MGHDCMEDGPSMASLNAAHHTNAEQSHVIGADRSNRCTLRVARCADVLRVARMCCALRCALRVCVACCILRRANTSYFIQKVERRHYLVVLLRDLRSEPARQR
jgi:hypothetical protein